NTPYAVALDAAGSLYISDYGNYRIRKITPDGKINTIIGSGVRAAGGETNAELGEAVPALQAKLYGVVSLKFDKQGNLYFADNWRLRRLTASDGLVRTYAGNGQNGPAIGNGEKAANVPLWAVSDCETDDAGNVYTAEVFFMRKVDGNGIINRFAGTGFYNMGGVCDPYPAGAVALDTCIYASYLARDAAGNFIIASNRSITRLDSAGRLFPLAGSGISNISFYNLRGIALDKTGAIYYLDDNRVRKLVATSSDLVRPQLEITEPAANTTLTSPYVTIKGTSSDNVGIAQIGVKVERGVSFTINLTVSSWDFPNLWLLPGPSLITVTAWDVVGNSTSKSVLVNYTPPNSLNTVAGTRRQGFNGEGGTGVAVQLSAPETVATDAAGNLYIADKGNHRIRKVTRTGQISTVAGNGQLGSSGDGGLASNAAMNEPNGVVVDSAGNLYISDTNNHRIRKVSAAGIITTIAGTGIAGFSGDGGSAVQAQLNIPVGLVLDQGGNLLIADAGNQRVRRLNLGTGVITTIAGNGYGSGGDGGQATQAQLNFPTGVALDQSGNLYIAETSNHQVRKVTPGGIISRYAGTGASGFSGDNGQATLARLSAPGGLAVDAAGNLYIADQNNNRVRKVTPTGIITTFAGNGNTQDGSDEGSAATDVLLRAPAGVTVDGAGNIFIADTDNHRVVVVAAFKTAATVNGASFTTQQPIAPEAIASVFGTNLATRDQAVTQLPLPTELAGTSVKVRDSLGIERLAPLFYVGKLQVNYQIPAGTAAGFATVTITNGNGEIFTSAVNVAGVTPGFFTANQNGSGVAAGSVLYVTGANRRSDNLAVCDANGQNCTPRQIDVNAASEVYLELYGTGWRNNSGLANVSVTVGGVAVPVLYAGPQPQFVGLDQINVQLPRSLAGRGDADVLLTVDGKVANAVKANFK
ncbi:MAG: SMP-30/gluconolactonase/LRE family protein, partial [Blastocatellia bacterium]